jgi:ankyrin repeat protein
MNPFLEAILIDSESEVKARLSKYPIDDQENLLEQSALHLAVSRPQHLQFLLGAGADVNARDRSGRTPLMYAAAAGSVEVAIALLRGGADPWMKDHLFGKEDFIHCAVSRDHWHLVMCALDYIRQSPRYSTQEVRSLLNTAIILWAGENLNTRRSDYFKSLLGWGADPEISFTEQWEFSEKETSNKLLHCITNSNDFDSLINSGFNCFNHSNSIGAHPLMKITAIGDAHLVRKCIEGGSLVNHQDHEGRTALHITTEQLWESFLQVEHDQCEHRARAMDSAKVLLKAGADPFVGDSCRCACSRAGCTPAHILLKEYYDFRNYTGTYPLAQYMWSFEWLHMLELVKGFKPAKQCVFDMLRLAKFEELELTHTCCRKYNRKKSWQAFCKGEAAETAKDVAEVMDEEAEIIEELELHMKEIEQHLGFSSDLESVWMDGLPQLLVPREQLGTGLKSGLETRESTAHRTLMDHFRYLKTEQRNQEGPRVSLTKHLQI